MILGACERAVTEGYLSEDDIGAYLLFGMVVVGIDVFYGIGKYKALPLKEQEGLSFLDKNTFLTTENLMKSYREAIFLEILLVRRYIVS